ncbi:MAG: hypothetical protein WC979_01420 [Candidatus Pacearchaeota archaeon]|jgi:nicotinamide mononucleotide adenylyltransferase|nr:hypothetical protein [Clostridia bacterium]
MKIEISKLKTLEQFINETNKNGNFVVSYSGKFQPFHIGHFDIYEQLVAKFGKENVYITTGDLNQSEVGKAAYDDNHFLSFDEKKLIMTKMFKIPPSKIVKVKNTYAPTELLTMFTKDTALITVLGGKDAERLTRGKYFDIYNDNVELDGYETKGYIYVQENSPSVNMSATEVRNYFRDNSHAIKDKENFFKKIYKKLDAGIFNLLNTKLNSIKESNETHPAVCKDYAEYYPNGWKDLDGMFMGPNAFKGFAGIDEGGAFGHLEHVYDDLTITFGQMKEIINLGLSGKLENTVEKTDGVTIAISYKDGKIVTARNKGEYKNFGENAVDKNALMAKFAGRGPIADAYNLAFDDLEDAIKDLNKKDLESIFKNGKCFMHLEVIYSPAMITVPYNTNLMVFHNVTEYDTAGNPLSQDRAAADKLAKMIADINKDIEKTFKIQGSPYVKLKDGVNFDKEKTYFNAKVDEIKAKWNFKDNNTFLDFYTAEWKDRILKMGYSLTDVQLAGLIGRWLTDDKSFRINKDNIPDEKTLAWAKDFEAKDAAKIGGEIKRIVGTIFVQVGVAIIKSLQTILAPNPDASLNQLKADFNKAIDDINKSGDEGALAKLKIHLQSLENAGGIDAIFPSEGICFNYGGRLFKLTGAFAPIHQIISALKF